MMAGPRNETHPQLTQPMPLQWLNRYHRLGEKFYTPQLPDPLPNPQWVAVSPEASQALGWPADWWQAPGALEAFSGGGLWPGMAPIATVYSGHQFGVWAGQLGDGRALLLGEVVLPRAPGSMELQLKGSGLTPYSRMGDGKAVLRSSIREFLCSHAMQALGVPTTRALCLASSPQPVQRETTETAAVVTRLAPSFVRFGHFEHFSYSGQHEDLRHLADHVLAAHLPEAGEARQPYLALLQHAVRSTADLMAHWQALGFCHGVMNTDNMSILGLTLDYGPFGFLDAYDPMHICNHSDSHGRYAFARQPNVAFWNLCALGQALSPLIADAQDIVTALEEFKVRFSAGMLARLRAKLGLREALESDVQLIDAWLRMLHAQGVDHTLAFRYLGDLGLDGAAASPRWRGSPLAGLFSDPLQLDLWLHDYQRRLQQEKTSAAQRRDLMQANNPRYILRNSLAHTAIERAQQGDFSEVQRLMQVLSAPYDDQPGFEAYAQVPPDWARHIEVSCSS